MALILTQINAIFLLLSGHRFLAAVDLACTTPLGYWVQVTKKRALNGEKGDLVANFRSVTSAVISSLLGALSASLSEEWRAPKHAGFCKNLREARARLPRAHRNTPPHRKLLSFCPWTLNWCLVRLCDVSWTWITVGWIYLSTRYQTKLTDFIIKKSIQLTLEQHMGLGVLTPCTVQNLLIIFDSLKT